MKEIIRLDGIKKSYGNKTILDDYSLSIKDEDKILIRGPSGSGKSTILNIIGGLEKVDSGETVHFGIKNLKPNSSKARILLRDKISYLFQNYALIDNDTVENNLALAIKGRGKKEKQDLINHTLGQLGLEGIGDRYVYTLSGGEQQRVALARLMMKNSEIILADEPTGNLDEENALEVIEALEDLHRSGKALVVVSHDKSLEKRFDKIIKLD